MMNPRLSTSQDRPHDANAPENGKPRRRDKKIWPSPRSRADNVSIEQTHSLEGSPQEKKGSRVGAFLKNFVVSGPKDDNTLSPPSSGHGLPGQNGPSGQPPNDEFETPALNDGSLDQSNCQKIEAANTADERVHSKSQQPQPGSPPGRAVTKLPSSANHYPQPQSYPREHRKAVPQRSGPNASHDSTTQASLDNQREILQSEELAAAKERVRELEKQLEISKNETKEMFDAANKCTETIQKQNDEYSAAQIHMEQERTQWQQNEEVARELEKDIYNLRGQNESLLKDVERLKVFQSTHNAQESEIRILQASLTAKVTELSESESKVDALDNRCAEAETKFADAQARLRQASTDLLRLRNESRSLHDDDFFASRWERLNGEIARWAKYHFGGTPRLKKDRKMKTLVRELDDTNHFIVLSADSAELLEDDSTRPFLIQAYIWSQIERKVFDRFPKALSLGFHWGYPVRPAILSLEQFLRPCKYYL